MPVLACRKACVQVPGGDRALCLLKPSVRAEAGCYQQYYRCLIACSAERSVCDQTAGLSCRPAWPSLHLPASPLLTCLPVSRHPPPPPPPPSLLMSSVCPLPWPMLFCLLVCLSLLYLLVSTASLAKWLRRPPRERKIPGSNPARAGIFSGSSHTSDLKIGTPVATLPGAWRYRVSGGTGRPGVSIL